MSDTNLDPSITALTNRASTVAVTATARELMNISRLAPSLEQSENTDLEVAINARAEDLAPSATATELKSIGKAIGNVLEPSTFVAGGTLPNQAQNSGNFLGTNGTAESWGGLSVSTLSEVNISSIMNDETLVYNHVSGLFENDSQVFRIQEIGLTENIPTSGSFIGQVVFDQQTSELKYWDGSEWKVAAVVAAAGGGGASIKSVVFDGSGDGFSVPDLTPTTGGLDLRFGGVQYGGVPYTVECWIKRTGKQYTGGDTGRRDVILEKGIWDAGEEFALYVNNNNSIRWAIGGLSSNRIIAPNDTIVMDQWHHIAICGDSSDEHRMWVDGVQVGNTYWSPNFADNQFNNPDTHEPLRIGHTPNTTGAAMGYDWIGKIADLRILVGTALYTGNFTPPTSPLEKIADTVLLTARGDTITDESDLARTVTVLGDTAPDADSPYPTSGGGSGSSFPVVDWTGADGTQRPSSGGSGVGNSLTSSKMSNGKHIVIAAVSGNTIKAQDLDDAGLTTLWSVASSGYIPDDSGTMSGSGDYFAAHEGSVINIRSASDGSIYRSDIGSIPRAVQSQAWSNAKHCRVYGDYVLMTDTNWPVAALINFQTQQLVWITHQDSYISGVTTSQGSDPSNYLNTWTGTVGTGIGWANIAVGENYSALHNSAHDAGYPNYRLGAVHIVDHTGAEVHLLTDPTNMANENTYFGGSGSNENGIAISGDKVLIGAFGANGGIGKVYIYDMPTGTLEYTIDENTAGGSTIANASKGQYTFGQEIDAHEDYAVISKYHEAYVVQVSTGTIVAHIPSINIDRQTIVGPYVIGGDLNTGYLRVFNGT